MHDLIIIGGGPAALSAAIYAGRAGIKTQIFERAGIGGTLAQVDYIENYPGFLGTGQALADSMREQALRFGAQIKYGECTSLKRVSEGYELIVDEEEYIATAVIVASGSTPKTLKFPLEIPVSYCAVCDGAFVKDKNIVVVGGANSAVQETLYLANLAKTVTIITHSRLKADYELRQRLASMPNINVIENTEPTPELLSQYEHCFVYIGVDPATSFVDASLLNPSGYVITDTSSPAPHQTVYPGLFAAGDVREGCTKQVVVAVADGAEAALETAKYLQNRIK